MADHPEVRIHIDQKTYHSPNPTGGVALYDLGQVPDDMVLYKEVSGDHEDKLIRVDAKDIHVTEDEHFHTGNPPEKHYTIIVNTRPFVLDHDVISFNEIVKLAYPVPPTGENIVYTVGYEHAKSEPHHGDMPESGKVTVRKHGTIFDVDHTNRS
jgi:hypothetical protein